MKNKKLISIIIIISLISFILGTSFGTLITSKFLINSDNNKEIISSTVILNKVKDQSFLITRTVITDEKSTIFIDQGSDWSNFWWSHEITAEALMQIDIGVDFTKIEEKDISIDNNKKEIRINLPLSEIYNISLEGDIEVATKSGILKKLLASDDNEDYNLALSELNKKAEYSVVNNEEIIKEAQLSALSYLQIILKDTGYSITVL